MKRKGARKDQDRGREKPGRIADLDRPQRLASEAGKLDKSQEQELADERYAAEEAWPDY